MNDTIDICKSKPFDKSKKICEYEDIILSLFVDSKWIYGKLLKITDLKIPNIYYKCKYLTSITNGNVNFSKIIEPYMRLKSDQFYRTETVTMLSAMLIKPLNKFDQEELTLYFTSITIYWTTIKDLLEVTI